MSQAKLQEQAQEFDKEASSAASLLHSIFGIKRSGTGSSTEGGPVEVAAAADAQSKSKAKPAPALPAEGEVERAPAQSLLGSLFGWRGTGKGATPATHDVQAAAPVAKAPAPAAKRRAAAPSATPPAAAPVETSQPEASGEFQPCAIREAGSGSGLLGSNSWWTGNGLVTDIGFRVFRSIHA